MALQCSYSYYRSDEFPNAIEGNIIFGNNTATNFYFFNNIDPVPTLRNPGDPVSFTIYFINSEGLLEGFVNGDPIPASIVTDDVVRYGVRIYFRIYILNFFKPLRVTADSTLSVYTIPASLITCECYPNDSLHRDFIGTFTQSENNTPLQFLSGPYTPNITDPNYKDYGTPYFLTVNGFYLKNGNPGSALQNNTFEMKSGLEIPLVNLNGINCKTIDKPFLPKRKKYHKYQQPWMWTLISFALLVGIWAMVGAWVYYQQVKFPHPTPEPDMEMEPMDEMEVMEDIKENIPVAKSLEKDVSRNETKIIDQLESLKDKLQDIKGNTHLEKFESIKNKLNLARKHISKYNFPKSLQ